jgi:methylenetetrahydrofolate reductase (NADPH)
MKISKTAQLTLAAGLLSLLSACGGDSVTTPTASSAAPTAEQVAAFTSSYNGGVAALKSFSGLTSSGFVDLFDDAFLDAGIRQFLALRGDPPEGSDASSDYLGELSSATELVELISQRGGDRVTVSVAAFPNGHPLSSTPQQDIEVLLAKQNAGAEFAITQLFFEANDYLEFATAAAEAGVTIPILPGIMPVTSLGRLRRIVDITGERMPVSLEAALDAAPSPAEARALGVAHAVDLCRALVAGGAPGLHLYAFNEHETVLDVLAQVNQPA